MDAISALRRRNLFMLIICLLSTKFQPLQCENTSQRTSVEYSVSSSSSSTNNVIDIEPHNSTDVEGTQGNHTREALSQDASAPDSVVFIGENPNYAPLPSLRTRTLPHLEDEDPDWPSALDTWDREYRRVRFNNTRVQHIEAECQDDYMKIRVAFNGTFAGLVYSAGYAYDPDCMYINESGRDYEFYIQLNRCGTLGKNTHNEDNRKSPTKNFMWNTVTVQYNPLIEEEYDEHFKVTCEYGYDFWKTVTFPFINVDVPTGSPVVFTLTPPECYMDIRYGYGTTGNRVTGPVRVGDPLTLIIYMRSKYDGFDIVVNDCYAHNGGGRKIQLIDEYGCPVDDKLISRFRGSWSEPGVFETQVFAYMKTFRFTGSPALYIECDVRMCHGRCPPQTCHWRNVKNVRKRSIAEGNNDSGSTLPVKAVAALSENVTLHQTLTVLQEGENDQKANISYKTNKISTEDPNNICLKTGWFAALLALGCGALCLLGGALLAMCTKMRKITIEKVLTPSQFSGYMNHRASFK
ncbi:EGF-like domain-containing protein 2 isoform X1 [Euwallacea fornicatus]|uniref:EGF-like domain-containing protein 2 isoform X1 n=2 Tax=Euwallacea fornicatus TaxID=995702 RepID=UPI00338FAB0D